MALVPLGTEVSLQALALLARDFDHHRTTLLRCAYAFPFRPPGGVHCVKGHCGTQP